MIFPEACKIVGYAEGRPAGDKVYFLSQYLVRQTKTGYEVLEVETEEGTSILRDIKSSHLLAGEADVCMYPEKVNLHNRPDLIRRARGTGKFCTVFIGLDEHMTIICEPSDEHLITIHVYDAEPPRPNLAHTIRDLEETGLFEECGVQFCYHIADIRDTASEVYPCRAAGFSRTIDNDRLRGDETVAGCLTGRQVLAECYGEKAAFRVTDICPANRVAQEPYIARCCRMERTGIGVHDGCYGSIVHWGASPRTIAEAVFAVCEGWEKRRTEMENTTTEAQNQ
ncbi:hypothetical protein L1S32_07265 [Methanogenium sp. S4BF]|uniref:DUF7714 family protein n=1 Tax=Methanogenium sp. S4BF TaxID=1789226 RepID=UPI002416C44B|nr:hypothetical protein [Methanogenium sp. S4BF]WFN33647.1 hypothetical protein L1S32_07265 [Methanogenium sp. S4BF]